MILPLVTAPASGGSRQTRAAEIDQPHDQHSPMTYSDHSDLADIAYVS